MHDYTQLYHVMDRGQCAFLSTIPDNPTWQAGHVTERSACRRSGLEGYKHDAFPATY